MFNVLGVGWSHGLVGRTLYGWRGCGKIVGRLLATTESTRLVLCAVATATAGVCQDDLILRLLLLILLFYCGQIATLISCIIL